MDDLDFSKVNPILGYKMYTEKDRLEMATRSAYGIPISVRSDASEA